MTHDYNIVAMFANYLCLPWRGEKMEELGEKREKSIFENLTCHSVKQRKSLATLFVVSVTRLRTLFDRTIKRCLLST